MKKEAVSKEVKYVEIQNKYSISNAIGKLLYEHIGWEHEVVGYVRENNPEIRSSALIKLWREADGNFCPMCGRELKEVVE